MTRRSLRISRARASPSSWRGTRPIPRSGYGWPGVPGAKRRIRSPSRSSSFFEDTDPEVTIQIFGTDLSDASVAKARAGVYPESISADVSPERLRRFFVKDGTGYRISKAVRDLCVFSRQNIVRDPPFSHLDLMSCRNVLIYLEPLLQRRVFPTFHYALEPHGLLVLGIAESAGLASEFLRPVNNHLRVYTRRDGVARLHDVDFPGPDSPATERRRSSRSLAPEPVTDQIQAGADRLVLTRHAPPGVVINDQFEILRFRGDTGAFLAHAPGAPSLQLLKLARSELVRPIQVAVGLARVEGKSVREVPVALIDGGVTSHVAIEVIPFQPETTGAGLFVVLFTQEQPRVDSTLHATSDAGRAGRSGRGRPRKGKEGARAQCPSGTNPRAGTPTPGDPAGTRDGARGVAGGQ